MIKKQKADDVDVLRFFQFMPVFSFSVSLLSIGRLVCSESPESPVFLCNCSSLEHFASSMIRLFPEGRLIFQPSFVVSTLSPWRLLLSFRIPSCLNICPISISSFRYCLREGSFPFIHFVYYNFIYIASIE